MRPEEIAAQQRAILSRMGARGRARGRKQRGRRQGMNRTEEAYAAHLELRRLAGEIASYQYQGIKFRLATGCWYEPDFAVMLPDGSIEIHEVKGHMEDDAAVKLRVFPEVWFWFRLVIVRRVKGGWEYEERT